MFQAKYDVFQQFLNAENEVVRTQFVCSIWLEVKSRTQLEQNKIAEENGGDILVPTTETRIIKK